MKDSKKTGWSWRVSAISAAATLVVAGAGVMAGQALAEGAPDGPPGAGMHGPMHGPKDMHGMKKRLDALQAKLNLNPSQTALWTQATSLMKPPEGGMEKHKEMHEKYLASLKNDTFDPHQWAADADAMHAAREAKGKEIKTAWLAVWDSLNPGQKTQVRQFLAERASFMERMRAHMMGHGDHHGAPSAPSTPVPPPKS